MVTEKRIGVLMDYETRSRCDIKIHGNSPYARDSSTEVMCLCVADVYFNGKSFTVDRSSKMLWRFDEAIPIEGFLPQDDELMFAFNAGFEYLITTQTLGIDFDPDKVYCLQHMALYNGLPASLDAISKAMPLEAPKDEQGHRLMLRMCKPQKDGTFLYDDEKMERLCEYCIQDIEAEAELLEKLQPASDYEVQCYRETLKINLAGLPVDLELAQKAKVMVDEISAELQSRFPDINLRSAKQIKDFAASHGYTMESTDKEHVANALADSELPAPVRELLEVKAAGVGSSSVSKFDAFLNFTDSDGYLRMTYRHHGAVRTGRWTSQGVQTQNIPRGEKGIVEKDKVSGRWFLPEVRDCIRKGDIDSIYMMANGRPMDAMRSVIRTLLAPPPGKVFVQRDLSAIEARGAFWIAMAKALQMFIDFDNGTGDEPYMIFANALGMDRFAGKQGLLSTNYGIGLNTLLMLCAAQGRKLSESEGQSILDMHKQMVPEVKNFWDKIGAAATACIDNPMTVYEVDGPTEPIRFLHEGNRMKIRLPSGRVLSYWDAKLQPGKFGPEITYMTHGSENGKALGWHRTRAWGGSITGHIVQGFSACLMRHISSELFKAGLPPVMLVHDEAVLMVDKADAQEAFDTMGEIMNTPPAWAKGLPVQSAGWIGDFYRKD
jgi:DNA polymerase